MTHQQKPLTLNGLNQDLWTKEDEKRLFPASPYEVAPITDRSKVSQSQILEDINIEDIQIMQKPPLSVKIDLGQGIFSKIVVTKDSDPVQTAINFCQEKGFPQEVC